MRNLVAGCRAQPAHAAGDERLIGTDELHDAARNECDRQQDVGYPECNEHVALSTVEALVTFTREGASARRPKTRAAGRAPEPSLCAEVRARRS